MSKNFILLVTLLYTLNLKAQHVELKQVVPQTYTNVSGFSAPNGSCDTLNAYAANSWQAYYYKYRGGGSVVGTNNLKATKNAVILEDANYFDVSGSDYNYITGGLVDFAFANTNTPENLTKNIVFKIYDDNGGTPGATLDSVKISLSKVSEDVAQGKLTEFLLATPLAVPASKKFYVSVDHSNFSWYFPVKDSIAIVATDNHATTNAGFQLTRVNGTPQWFPLPHFWRNADGGDSLDLTLYIFPYLRNSLSVCNVLPVNILNFGGFIKDNKAYLNWSTATESNNKGFYVERSKDGRNFSSIGFVNGVGNSSQLTNYTYTDITVKDILATTTYYRIKQVDIDGKESTSSILKLDLKNTGAWRLYPNPVKDIATVELNLTASSKVSLQVISRDGKIVISSDKGTLTQGTQQIFIHTSALAKGSYVVRVKTDKETYSMPMVKE